MVIVFSTGRSGTNIALEILTGSQELLPSLEPEHKGLFKIEGVEYPPFFLAKSDSAYCPTYELFGLMMKINPNAKIIWTIRHPFDLVMSKIRRGFPVKSDDGTLKGCCKDMFWMTYLYSAATKEFPGRILLIKMEDMILEIERETKRMCSFLNISFDRRMLVPWERYRQPGKKERYPSGLDKRQLDMYKTWKEQYNGFLIKVIDFNMEDLFNKVQPLVEYFGYRDER